MSRLIQEAAVIALVEGKIEALERKIEERRFPDGNAGAISLGEAKAKIAALQSVLGHLRFIPDADSSDPAHPFPIADAQEA